MAKWLLLLTALAFVLLPLSKAPTANAAVFAPTTVAELIAAINSANGNAEADVINLVPGMTYSLTEVDNDVLWPNGLPIISSDITINGNGATIERSGGNPPTPALFPFYITVDDAGDTYTVELDNNISNASIVAVLEGDASGDLDTDIDATEINGVEPVEMSSPEQPLREELENLGVDVDALAGELVVLVVIECKTLDFFDVTFVNEDDDDDSTTLEVDCEGSGDEIPPFRIFIVIDGALRLNALTVSGGFNSGTVGGGGILNYIGDSVTVLTNSTVSRNTAIRESIESGAGGGITVFGGTFDVANSTVSGNMSEGFGGGIWVFDGFVTLTNSTVTDNSGDGGDGIQSSGVVLLENSIVAQQQAGPGCAGPGTLTSLGNNLDSDDTCNLIAPSDIPGGNADLGPFANNGGPTETHALLIGSDAIDAGDNATCATAPVSGVDQRGVSRPQGPACDNRRRRAASATVN